MAASDLLKTITTAAAADDRKKAAVELAKVVKAGGMITLGKEKILETIQKGIDDKKQNVAREGASNAIQVLCEELGTPSEPYLLTFLPTLLELFADKAVPVRTASLEAATTLIAKMSPHALQLILPVIFTGLEYSRKWQTKTGSLSLFSTLVKSAPFQMAAAMPELVPIVSECMWDTKDEVKAAAKAAMTDLCVLIANKDIERFLPALVSCIANPEEVPECVHLLGATTFVQAVETPTLAIMVPLLARGLNERQTAIKRKTALIIDNMCKLVDNPDIAAPFLPKLLPGLHKIEDEVADPECRGVVAKAFATLLKVSGSTDGKIPETFTPPKKADENEIIAIVKEMIAAHGKYDEFYNVAVEYLGKVGACLINARNFSYQAWKEAVVPFVSSFFSAEVAEKVAKSFHDKCYENTSVDKDVEDDEEEGEDLCNCEFSLAYGAKILLNQARLRLKRGHRYGLCGPNGAGKSTLMRAIANGQVENFPPKELLRTVYVEHDIDGSLSEIPVIEFVVNDPAFANDNRDHIVKVLESVGFDKAKLESPVAALSGGWKMKLALARAMLMNADIMLLDEPTNHLDVVNVAWLESYLNGLKNVTSIIVSHDSGFLDRVCTDIIHYERYKLKRYKGNLSKFVERVPEARSYYDLSVSQQKFSFPEPGYLEGVKTKERAIIKMRDVSFQYPGTDRMQLKNISFQCSLSSRVAVIGPNGAGKSTMIKLLTGEIEPLEGTVWKHPNLRIAYVAQHAFHHIEKHQDKTPNQYIQWRYQTGEDMEELSKVNRVMTEEELKNMTKIIVVEGVKRTIDALVGRRKLKNSYEYECSFIGMSTVDNMWVSRKQLEEMGLIKMINECDSQEAAKQGLNRPLTQREIEKHLAEVGLEPEFGTHSHIKGLSGGQKVKLVIGAAMWNRPHLLVLDEPTNYLDRDSLGALATAIKSYGGGVVMISHNSQFTEHLCGEVWTINHGTLTASGHNWVQGNGGTKIEEKEAEDMVDAAGNTIKAVVQKKLTGKELRKKKKEKEARRKRGEEVSDDEDD